MQIVLLTSLFVMDRKLMVLELGPLAELSVLYT